MISKTQYSIFKVIFFPLLVLLVLLLAGCKTEPVYSVKDHPIALARGIPMKPEEISNGIVQAGNRLGWKMNRKGPNAVLAFVDNNDRQAVVLISFSEKTYSIKHLKSQNFLYDGHEIHKSYNNLVLSLVQSIDNEFYRNANKTLFEKGKIYIKKIPVKNKLQTTKTK